MKKLDQNLPHSQNVNEGWAIHIYGSNRRLLCTLDPSHGWSMLAGLALGAIVTVGFVDFNHYPSAQPPEPAAKPMQAPLSVD
jgi:hypothetical protein